MHKNVLAKSVRLALIGGVAAAAFASPAVFAADEDGAKVERIEVTGSRIRRVDLENASPVEVINAKDFNDMGRYSVADALRSSTFNSFGSLVPSSGSSAQSQASVNLLGLGSSRTLVLLDGVRLAASPTLSGASININQIPMSIVERIEILKDGGSAVYGSDAIAGVVNIITKKNFEGLSITGRVARPEDEGGQGHDFSVTTGISSDKGNITFSFEKQVQEPIFDRDRPYTAPFAEDADGNGILDYNSSVGISSYGASIKNPNTGLWEASPECENLANTVDGFVGALESGDNQYCGFAYSGVSANQASTDRQSIFVNANYEISDDLRMKSRAMITQNKSFGRYAPAAAGWDDIPANSLHNPYDVTTDGRFRWYQLGNRDGNVTDLTQDYMVGLEGDFGETAVWETFYHHSNTNNKSVGEYYLSYAGLYTNLLLGIPLGDGVDNMKTTTLQQDDYTLDQYFAGVSFEAGELPGGAIGHYVGAEAANIKYSSTVDAQSEVGLVGGSAGNSSGRGRDTWAVFYEGAFPITDELELGIAARYDDYSDFGTNLAPKVSLTYKPMDDLMLRASYGEGFRAPALETLSQADSFAADYANDYVYCRSEGTADGDCPELQYDTTRQANADLDAETSKTINFGIVWSGVEGLSVTADFYNVKIDNAIRFVPIQDIVMMELLGSANPDADKITVDRTTDGASQPIFRTSTINGPGTEVTGTNVNVTYLLETSAIGEIRFNSSTNYFFEYKSDSYVGGPIQDQGGFSLQPEYKTQFTTTWMMNDHSLAWNIDYIPSTSSYETPASDSSGNLTGSLTTNDSNDSFMTHNLTYSYDAGAYGKYTLGARNITDEDPVFDSNGQYGSGYDALYSAGHIGRSYTLAGEWNF
jgi:iron complex outermembrane receptor protein